MAKANIDLRDYILSLSNHIKLIYERLEKNEAKLDNISAEIIGIKDNSLIKMDLKLPPIPSTQLEKPPEKVEGSWLDRRTMLKKARARFVEESYGTHLQLLLEMDELAS